MCRLDTRFWPKILTQEIRSPSMRARAAASRVFRARSGFSCFPLTHFSFCFFNVFLTRSLSLSVLLKVLRYHFPSSWVYCTSPSTLLSQLFLYLLLSTKGSRLVILVDIVTHLTQCTACDDICYYHLRSLLRRLTYRKQKTRAFAVG